MNILKEVYIKAIENNWSNAEIIAEMKKHIQDPSVNRRLKGHTSNKIYVCLLTLISKGIVSDNDMKETVAYILQNYGSTYYNQSSNEKLIFNPTITDFEDFSATKVLYHERKFKSGTELKKFQIIDGIHYLPFYILTMFMNDMSDTAEWKVKDKDDEYQKIFDMDIHCYIRTLYVLY